MGVRGRLGAGLVWLVVLGLVGGCAAARFSGSARGMAPPVRTQAELASALLRVEDLPPGYTSTPEAPSTSPGEGAGSGGGSGGGAQPCADVFEQLRGGSPALSRIAASTAEVGFGKGDYGPFLQQALLSTGDRAAVDAAVSAFRQLPALCDGFTETDEQGSFTVKLSATDSLPMVGEDSVSLKLDANGRNVDLDVTISGYMILFRQGSAVCILIHFGIPGVDVAETEKIVRAAVARVG